MDNRHPKLKELMNPYFEKFYGQLYLVELLNATDKRQSNFLKLPKFTHPNRQPFICWNSTLGHYMFRECKYMRMQAAIPSRVTFLTSLQTSALTFLAKGSLRSFKGGRTTCQGKI
jgi:hypothetical protein